ncbi:hypothetical protein BH11ACT8_BH11ACT8_04390 [soil metagenome]
MPSITSLKAQGLELLDQRDALRADPRPWSAKQAEYDTMTKNIDAVVAQVTDLKAVGDSGPFNAGTRGTPSGSGWAAEVARRVTKSVGEFGVKAITTGGVDVPNVVEPVIETRTVPTRILDLVGRKPLAGNEFEYLRQTVRTNNSAPVADNATKPTSVYTFEDESDRARVFAHLSEAIPLRYLSDHAELEQMITSQMAQDLFTMIEGEVVNGDGTGEHFTGITNTSGVQTQAFTTNVLTTLRKAYTKLDVLGEAPNAWVLNHTDLEAIDLMLDGDNNFMGGIEAKIFRNLPRIGSSLVPAGTALLGDWNQTRLYVREGGRLDADTSGVLFDKNQAKLRFEGRFGFAVLRPIAFIIADLTA